LGEISPVGRLCNLGRVLKFTEIAQMFGLLFSRGTSDGLILTKKHGWATFWATFSQTHLVARMLCGTQKICR
jgi:hypothetical protein